MFACNFRKGKADGAGSEPKKQLARGAIENAPYEGTRGLTAYLASSTLQRTATADTATRKFGVRLFG